MVAVILVLLLDYGLDLDILLLLPINYYCFFFGYLQCITGFHIKIFMKRCEAR